MPCFPHIVVYKIGLIGTPYQSRTSEGGEEQNTIVELSAGTGFVEFVKEPVDV
jgi:hypothetical protein